MEKISVLIYGAGGHGKVVFDCCKRLGFNVLGFIDDDSSKTKNIDLPVFRKEFLHKFKGFIALGIGNNSARKKIYQEINRANLNILTIIDINATVSSFSTIGNGTVVFPKAVINNSAKIGVGCIINTGAIVEHDCIIGDFSHISPNAALAGGVMIGNLTQIGIGAVVKENTKIGNNVIVGAGAVVVKDIPDNVIVIGNPAKVLRKNA